MKKTIPVIGMACSVCSANVEKKLQSLEGINSASVSLASRTALVDYDPDIISLEDMKREISNAGYDLVIESNRSVEEINRREFTLLRRRTLASGENFIMDRIGDARIFGAARAENKSKNLFFAESRQK